MAASHRRRRGLLAVALLCCAAQPSGAGAYSRGALPIHRPRPWGLRRVHLSWGELDQAVALNGGDRWSGARVTPDELREICDAAVCTNQPRPVIPQFHPRRRWLWRQWTGTIVCNVLPREVAFNTFFAILITAFFRAPGPNFAWREGLVRCLSSVDQVWFLTSGLVTFTLSFFLTQSYALWREVYTCTRRVQGRLNDIGLLCATTARRDDAGSYLDHSERLLESVARYVRLFNILLYASVTRRFAPLRTPAGLNALVEVGAMTDEERLAILDASNGQNTVLQWIVTLVNTGIHRGDFGDGSQASQTALYTAIAEKATELRSAYASIPDLLSGRMPLAYTQLVQILTDMLVLFTPFALIHSVGGVGAVVGTALVTLFHTSILNLAKILLDPFNNEDFGGPSRIAINVDTLVAETNLGSNRWRRGARWVPREARAYFQRDTLPVVGPVAGAAQAGTEGVPQAAAQVVQPPPAPVGAGVNATATEPAAAGRAR